MTLEEKLKEDMLNILLKLSIADLEALKSRFEPSSLIDEAMNIKQNYEPFDGE